MKKNIFYLTLISLVVMAMSSCTKEQMTLNKLYGTWQLDSRLDSDGVPVLADSTYSESTEWTFWRCKDKSEEDCFGTMKTTRDYVNPLVDNSYSTSEFTYSVFQDKQLVINGDFDYEIEEISKKTLKIHRVNSPLATWTFSKVK